MRLGLSPRFFDPQPTICFCGEQHSFWTLSPDLASVTRCSRFSSTPPHPFSPFSCRTCHDYLEVPTTPSHLSIFLFFPFIFPPLHADDCWNSLPTMLNAHLSGSHFAIFAVLTVKFFPSTLSLFPGTPDVARPKASLVSFSLPLTTRLSHPFLPPNP